MSEVTLKFTGDNKSLKAATDEATASLKQLRNEAALARAEFAAGQSTQREYQSAMKQIAQRTVDARTTLLQATEAMGGATQGMHAFGASAAGAQKELAVLAGEALRGNVARLEQSLVVLARQTGILGGAMKFLASPIGVVVGLVAAAAGVVAYFILKTIEAEGNVHKFADALVLTNGYAGQTAQQLNSVAETIARGNVKYKESAVIILELAQSGKFAGETLNIAAQGVVNYANLLGGETDKAVETATKAFEKLAQSPTKALEELNQQTHLVSASTIALVANAEASGNAFAAGAIATQVFSKAVADAAAAAEQSKQKIKELQSQASLPVMGAMASENENLNRIFVQQALAAQTALEAQSRLDQQRATSSIIADAVNTATGGIVAGLEQERAKLDEVTATYGKGKVGLVEYTIAKAKATVVSIALSAAETAYATALRNGQSVISAARAAYDQFSSAVSNGIALIDLEGKKLHASAEAADAAVQAHKDSTKAAREAEVAQRAYNTAIDSAAKFLTGLEGKIDPVSAAYSRYKEAMIESTKIERELIDTGDKLGQGDQARAAAAQVHIQAQTASLSVLNSTLQKIATEGDVLGAFLAKSKNDAVLASLAPRAQAVAKAVDSITVAYKALEAKGVPMKQSLEEVAKAFGDDAAHAYDAKKAADELNNIISEFGKATGVDSLLGKFQLVTAELKRMKEAGEDATDPKRFHELQVAAVNLNHAVGEQYIQSLQAGLHSLQSMTKEGSKAYKTIQIAVDALTVAQAILAVVQAAQLPPPAGFVSMAAMAAAVVALGVDIGNFNAGGAPSSQSSQVRQAQQGTGTVLGDAQAQSDSIAKATAITADATQQLVGLNRGMLVALQALQNALGAAGTQLAHGAGNATFPALGSGFNLDPFGGDPLTGAISGFLFGGKQKVIDQGIVIFGGALSDMLNGIAVGAYQTIHKSGGVFGSSKTYDQTQSVSDAFTKQFQLVIGSLVDAVRQGATALGLSKTQIDAAIAAYHIAEQHISLQGLSSEDQQKALEAVFSSIFDGLAAAVVPFIGQFQKVGEGLGETLIRVATEVQVTQQAMKQLGLAISTTDPEKFAQIADALINAVGGIDAFIQGMNDFTDKFASSDQKFKLEKDALTSAFSQVGLTLPATREGMYDLMQSLDATTDAGRAQIATLLRLAGVADAYYTALEKTGDAQENATDKLKDSIKSLADTITQAAAQLFGTSADQIQAKIDALLKFGSETGLYDFRQITALKKQLKDQQEAQAKAQQLQQATGLLTNLGQLGALTGNDLATLAQKFNIPLDKFAQLLGTDQAGLEQQYQTAVDTAKAAMDTATNTAYANELLANILAAQQGLPLPYSDTDVAAAKAGASPAVGTKPGGPFVGRLPASTVAPASNAPAGGSTKPVVDAVTAGHADVVAAIRENTNVIRRAFNMPDDSPRNTRQAGNGIYRQPARR
jgi:hypothetical protein